MNSFNKIEAHKNKASANSEFLILICNTLKNMKKNFITLFALALLFASQSIKAQSSYNNFNAAVYVRAFELKQMADENWMKKHFEILEKQIKISKVYFEVLRDLELADKVAVQNVQKYFKSKGIKVSAGLALVKNENNNFETFCYSNSDDKAKILDIIKFAAG